MTEPNLDKEIDELLYANKDTNYDSEELPFDTLNSYGFKQDIKELIANQVREARLEEAKLFNRYFDDNQSFKGFAEERLKELGE